MSGFWRFCNIPYTDFTFISPRCKMVRRKSIKFQTTNLEKREDVTAMATNSFPTQKHKRGKKKKQSQNTKLRNLQALYASKAVLQEHSHLPQNWRGTYYKYINPRFNEAITTDDYLLYNILKHQFGKKDVEHPFVMIYQEPVTPKKKKKIAMLHLSSIKRARKNWIWYIHHEQSLGFYSSFQLGLNMRCTPWLLISREPNRICKFQHREENPKRGHGSNKEADILRTEVGLRY